MCSLIHLARSYLLFVSVVRTIPHEVDMISFSRWTPSGESRSASEASWVYSPPSRWTETAELSVFGQLSSTTQCFGGWIAWPLLCNDHHQLRQFVLCFGQLPKRKHKPRTTLWRSVNKIFLFMTLAVQQPRGWRLSSAGRFPSLLHLLLRNYPKSPTFSVLSPRIDELDPECTSRSVDSTGHLAPPDYWWLSLHWNEKVFHWKEETRICKNNNNNKEQHTRCCSLDPWIDDAQVSVVQIWRRCEEYEALHDWPQLQWWSASLPFITTSSFQGNDPPGRTGDTFSCYWNASFNCGWNSRLRCEWEIDHSEAVITPLVFNAYTILDFDGRVSKGFLHMDIHNVYVLYIQSTRILRLVNTKAYSKSRLYLLFI